MRVTVQPVITRGRAHRSALCHFNSFLYSQSSIVGEFFRPVSLTIFSPNPNTEPARSLFDTGDSFEDAIKRQTTYLLPDTIRADVLQFHSSTTSAIKTSRASVMTTQHNAPRQQKNSLSLLSNRFCSSLSIVYPSEIELRLNPRPTMQTCQHNAGLFHSLPQDHRPCHTLRMSDSELALLDIL